MAGPSNNQIVGIAAAVVLGGMAIATIRPDWVSEPADQQAQDGVAQDAPAKLGPEQVARCRAALTAGTKSGVIRARPSPNRINVEDRLWAEMDAHTKELILQAVACDAWGMAAPPQGQFVVSYGYRSGKRIEMLSELGIDRE